MSFIFAKITSSEKAITVKFNSYAMMQVPTGRIPHERTMGKQDLIVDRIANDLTEVHVELNKQKFLFSRDGSNSSIIIDEVDGVVITSNLELHEAIKNLVQ